ncbi:hypothetical protein [uncultured Helicobacter sp.]|uniref:hypothetical protein n=1 Tax=uncultured Helicobacter sp. TaxID=175537 RepID=UPI002627F3BA|nr:hypothetical protein [uncultured Helicobacter sp.]
MKKTFDFSSLANKDFKEFILALLLKNLGFVNRDVKNPKPLKLALSLIITAPTILGSNEKITLLTNAKELGII